MIIKVKYPLDCPLRHVDRNNGWCAAKREEKKDWHCKNPVEFPKVCPLRSRTVIVQKEEAETIPKHEEKPVTADIEK